MTGPEPGERAAAIRAYFEACNTGAATEIAAHFTDQAVIYDTNHAPVGTAAGIGRFWDRIRAQWQGAVWQVDSVVAQGDYPRPGADDVEVAEERQ